jgi:hypothetical protein
MDTTLRMERWERFGGVICVLCFQFEALYSDTSTECCWRSSGSAYLSTPALLLRLIFGSFFFCKCMFVLKQHNSTEKKRKEGKKNLAIKTALKVAI